MTYQTIITIGKLLKEDVEDKQKQYKIAKEHAIRAEKEADKENLLYSQSEDWQYWEESRKKHREQLRNAENVLEDFLQHDWH